MPSGFVPSCEAGAVLTLSSEAGSPPDVHGAERADLSATCSSNAAVQRCCSQGWKAEGQQYRGAFSQQFAALAQVLAPLLHIFFTITSNHLVRAMRLARLSAQHAAAAQLLPFQERVSTQPPATIG